MNYRVMLSIFAIGLFLTVGSSSYFSERQQIKQATKETIQFRIDSFKQYVHLMTTNNLAMRNSMLSHYKLAQQGNLKTPMLDGLTFFAEHKVYGLSAIDTPNHAKDLHGTLTISAGIDVNDPKIMHELTAAIALDAQLAAYVGEADLAVWSYYMSKHNFFYLLPKLKVGLFVPSKEVYAKPFWTQSVPTANPSGKQIVSALYDDAAGSGLMVTITSPVTLGNDFLGIVGLDVGIGYMQSVLEIGDAVGESILVDEESFLVARKGKLAAGDSYHTTELNTNHEWVEQDDAWIFAAPIQQDELYFVHVLPKSALMISAIEASLAVWLLISLGCVLSYLAYQMHKSSLEHRELMLIDPLTKIYNRRGLEALITPIYANLKRSKGSCAILLIDIDKFKVINDTYGHSIGDEVIISTASILNSVNRKDTICARWGGEEFIVFLQDATAHDGVLVAERIRKQIEAASHSQQSLKVTISIGVSTTIGDEVLDTVIDQADLALYKAKNNGRNRSEIF